MIFIGCASLAGLSYCFFSIDALGSSSTVRFEPIEQRPLLANSNRYNRLKKCRSNHQEWSIRISTRFHLALKQILPFPCTVINTSTSKKEIRHSFTHTRISIHIIFNTVTNITKNTNTNITISIITITIITITIITITIITVAIIIITINNIICQVATVKSII